MIKLFRLLVCRDYIRRFGRLGGWEVVVFDTMDPEKSLVGNLLD